MNITQTLRRLGQQMTGWTYSYSILTHQLKLIKKLYSKNGLEIKNTSGACPEQYDVFKDGKQVGYLRLRWGGFRVDYPDAGGETIYEADPIGDGVFDEHERLIYLTKAMRSILKRLEDERIDSKN